VLPTDDINSKVFTFTEESAIADNFDEFGYEQKNFIQNLGSLYYFFPYFCICLIVLLLLKLISMLGCSRPQKWYQQLKAYLFWNFLLRFTLEAYLELHLSATINVANLLFTWNSGDWIGALTSILVTVIVNAFPFALGIFYHRNFERVSDEGF